MKTLVNLTPHTINLFGSNDSNQAIPSTGVARCVAIPTVVGEVNGVPVRRTQFGAVTGLPEPSEGVIFIVSMLVASAAKRDDVVFPDDVVRDPDGKIIGCRALGCP
jgi:hypothetical protein